MMTMTNEIKDVFGRADILKFTVLLVFVLREHEELHRLSGT